MRLYEKWVLFPLEKENMFFIMLKNGEDIQVCLLLKKKRFCCFEGHHCVVFLWTVHAFSENSHTGFISFYKAISKNMN